MGEVPIRPHHSGTITALSLFIRAARNEGVAWNRLGRIAAFAESRGLLSVPVMSASADGSGS
jgi:hypothetical protein